MAGRLTEGLAESKGSLPLGLCVSLWAWWELVTAHHRVHDYACVSLWAWWEVVTANHRVYDYACVIVCHCGSGGRW